MGVWLCALEIFFYESNLAKSIDITWTCFLTILIQSFSRYFIIEAYDTKNSQTRLHKIETACHKD